MRTTKLIKKSRREDNLLLTQPQIRGKPRATIKIQALV
jgi:hypothetical protein